MKNLFKSFSRIKIFLVAVILQVANVLHAQTYIQKVSGSGCAGTETDFTFTHGCSNVTWSAPGAQIILQNSTTLNVKYNSAGTYSVSASYSGCSSSPTSGSDSYPSFTISPLVTPSVSIAITAGTNPSCQGTSVTFTATPTNGGSTQSYSWRVNGNTVYNGSNTYTTSSLANGDVVTTVMTPGTSCVTQPTATSNAITMTITPKPVVSVTIGGSALPLCNGLGTFVAQPQNAVNPTYTWLRNTTVVSTSNSYSVSASAPLTAGELVVCVVNSQGCVSGSPANSSLRITTTSPITPSINISPSTSDACTGDNVTFTASPHDPAAYTLSNYSWKLNGVQIGPNNSPIVGITGSAAASGDITVTATATGSCISSTNASAEMLPGSIKATRVSPVATISPVGSPPGTLKIGATASTTLSASPSAAYGYGWNSVNTVSGTSTPLGVTTQTYTTSQAGVYTVTVNVNGCTNTSSQLKVVKNTPPTVNAGPDIVLVRPQDAVSITPTMTDADGDAITSYSWSMQSYPAPGYGLSVSGVNTLQLSNLSAGTYVLRATASDAFDTGFDDVTVTVVYPPNNYNMVRETDVLIKDQRTSLISDIAALSITGKQKNVTVNYFDGLGRPMQTISQQASPGNKNDMIKPFVFDNVGRQSFAYLPVTISQTNGYYLDNSSIIDNGTQNYKGVAANIYADTRPFSETLFESSELNRPLKQYGPGEKWKIKDANGNFIVNRFVEYKFSVNQHNPTATPSLTTEKIIAWKIDPKTFLPIRAVGSVFESGGYYSTNQLTIASTKDEQGNEVREYKNKLGQIVLKKVQVATAVNGLDNNTQWALTYYIYDELGHLVFVLQPKLSALTLGNDTYVPTQSDLNQFAFQYQYDERARVRIKKVPGADSVTMVYDARDRLVMTQDGEQRKLNQWTYTKYDAFDRPIVTGIYTHPILVFQPKMRSFLSATNFFETYNGDASTYGYTNTVFPTSTLTGTFDPLTVTYYDNYNFRTLFTTNNSFNYLIGELVTNGDQPGQESVENQNVTGHVTGTKIRMISTAGWLKTVNYYDGKYRLIQQIADNAKGHTVTTTTYDFAGKSLRTKTSLYTGQPVTWDTGAGKLLGSPTLSGNNISFTGSSGTDWTQGAISVQSLPANTDGWIEVTLSQVNVGFMLGLGHTGTPTYNNIDFAWYVGSTQLNIRKNGNTPSYGGAFGNVQSGDVLRIERINGKIYYKKNGLLVYPTPSTLPANIDQSTAQLYFYVTLRNAASKVNNVVLSNTFSIPTVLLAPVSSVTKRMDYDHAGRLTNTWHKIGRVVGGTFSETSEVLLAQNTYNEIGQLIDKKLHSTLADASNAKQSVDYRYNIRGWLTSINNAELSGTGTNDDSGDLFGMNLAYNDDLGTGNAANPQYNGNINAIKWSTGRGLGTVKELAYNFTYDAMNRLSNANSQKYTANNWSAGDYDERAFDGENGIQYDLNGNILHLQRKGAGGGLIDKLDYNYTAAGNQLQRVDDGAPGAADKPKGFYDGYTGVDYTYDANGNLIVDRNKNLIQSGSNPQAIFYNYLNLPEKVCKYGNDNIVYVYDATGIKHAQVVTQSNTQKNTEYVGPWVFEDNALQFIQHEEGRIVMAKEQLLYINSCDAVTSDMQATANVAQLTPQTINGEKYVQVTCSVSSAASVKPGLTFGTIYNVVEGERYRFRVKGYFNGTYVTLNVKGNGTDLLWPGTSLPRQPISESWVEQIILVPAGVTQLTLGVLWNGATTANSDNFLINEIEFYQLFDNSAVPEYQYNIKDHLGNVRVSFTSLDDAQSDVATMEPANQLNETKAFVNYEQIRVVKNSALFDHTNDPGGSGASIRLSGNANEKTGLVKTLSVMPGDIIHVEVYAKYLDPNTTNWDAALTTLVSNISAGSTSVVSDGPLYNTNASQPFPYTGLNGTGSSSGTGPKAYLNYITFDEDFNPILPAIDPSQTNYKRMSSAAKENGKNSLPDGVAHEPLVADVTIKQPGYMYIYLSNEETTPVEVYFDDFKVTQTKSPVIQTQDYYPFGLTFNSSRRENSITNRWRFQGQEHNDDLGLNWDSFKWRNDMPDIGRFFGIDPLAEKYVYNSPYVFSEDKVIRHIELEGAESMDFMTHWAVHGQNAIITYPIDWLHDKIIGGGMRMGEGAKEYAKNEYDHKQYQRQPSSDEMISGDTEQVNYTINKLQATTKMIKGLTDQAEGYTTLQALLLGGVEVAMTQGTNGATKTFNKMVENILTNPKASADEIAASFSEAGFKARVNPLRTGRGHQVTVEGFPGINTIKVHGGGGRHGLARVEISGSKGVFKIVEGSAENYKGSLSEEIKAGTQFIFTQTSK